MIPEYTKPFLWSYDTEKLDIEKNKKRIITNILNLGTYNAVKWLFKIYNKDDIKDAVLHPMPGEWNKKSLHFWSVFFDIKEDQIIVRNSESPRISPLRRFI